MLKASNNTDAGRAINIVLEEEIINLLPFSDSGKDSTATSEDAASEPELPDARASWETEINGEIVYNDANILTMVLSSYTYAGGAHGHEASTYLNFDIQSGKVLEHQELFNDMEAFRKFAEAQFRKQKNIPQTGNINATGFMFEDDAFHLPENIGYTPEGLRLIYNPYEVASYADGAIVLTLPYAEVNPYLRWEVVLE